ncbi:hypothetical protein [Pseudonocardia dioxanivorans]|uniref:hypothetical protein n=1 Tax=Pseudonocardia dioxanivorans TaxID=240495 RepID=UPI000CD24E14|nr:hypothetical protein [Pseudonocardia dioxanivorans]
MTIGSEEWTTRVLSWFVVRARRVEAHSLLANRDAVVRWARGGVDTAGDRGRSPSRGWSLPPEEALDSLAVRCRPFVARGAAVHWEAVTMALRAYVRGPGDALGESLERLCSGWRRLELTYPGPLVFSSPPTVDGREPDRAEVITDIALGHHWLYGESLPAADRSLQRFGAHELADRYRASVVLVANVALLVISTLGFMRVLWERVELDLPDYPFTRPVTATTDAELSIPVRDRARRRRVVNPEPDAALDVRLVTGRWLPIDESLPFLMSARPEDLLR